MLGLSHRLNPKTVRLPLGGLIEYVKDQGSCRGDVGEAQLEALGYGEGVGARIL